MAHDVFISYASENKPIADAVCAALESRRIRCWIAPRDIIPGSTYGSAIIDAIAGSRLLVLVFSAHANESPQVMREVERAVSRGLPIIPFRLEDVPLSKEMEYFISAPHWLDALSTPIEQHIERLVDTVETLLGRVSAIPREAPFSSRPAPRASGRTRRRGALIVAAATMLLLALLAYPAYLWIRSSQAPVRESSATPAVARSPEASTPPTQPTREAPPFEFAPESPKVVQEAHRATASPRASPEANVPAEPVAALPEAVRTNADAGREAVPSPVEADTKPVVDEAEPPVVQKGPVNLKPMAPPAVVPDEASVVEDERAAALASGSTWVGTYRLPDSADRADLVMHVKLRDKAKLTAQLVLVSVSNQLVQCAGTVDADAVRWDTDQGVRYEGRIAGPLMEGEWKSRQSQGDFRLDLAPAQETVLEPGAVLTGDCSAWASSDRRDLLLVVNKRDGLSIFATLYSPAESLAGTACQGSVFADRMIIATPAGWRFSGVANGPGVVGTWYARPPARGDFRIDVNPLSAGALEPNSVWAGTRQLPAEPDRAHLIVSFDRESDGKLYARVWQPFDEGRLDAEAVVVADRCMLGTRGAYRMYGRVAGTHFAGAFWEKNRAGDFAIDQVIGDADSLETGTTWRGTMSMPRTADHSDVSMTIRQRNGEQVYGGILLPGAKRETDFDGGIIANRLLIKTRTGRTLLATVIGDRIVDGQWREKKTAGDFVLEKR